MVPEYITIHNTDNDASANNEIAYMQRNDSSTSFHIAVDDFEAVQGLPLDRNGWHAGDGNGNGNRKSIAIEICYSLSGGEKFIKAEENAALLTAAMLKARSWDISRVKKHQDWSGKECPKRTMDDTGWQNFLNKVTSYMKGETTIEMRYFKLKEEMNMRTTPNGKIVAVIPEGEVISGSEFAQNSGIDWLKTSYSGVNGFVAVLPASKNYATEILDVGGDFEAKYREEKSRADALQAKIDAIKEILG